MKSNRSRRSNRNTERVRNRSNGLWSRLVPFTISQKEKHMKNIFHHLALMGALLLFAVRLDVHEQRRRVVR